MVLITMAGNGSRFWQAGYSEIKYLLMLGELNLFQRSLLTFKELFNNDLFVFVYRPTHTDEATLRRFCKEIGLDRELVFVPLLEETSGQAETAYKAISLLPATKDQQLMIFNIDTFYQNIQSHVALYKKKQSFIDLFCEKGSHWSFACLDENNEVTRVAEKNRISDYCSTGMYGFSDIPTFQKAFLDCSFTDVSEKFVMPMYNLLIGNTVVVGNVLSRDSVFVSGTPDEYEFLLESF